ncbi:MAG: hypothetical protein CFE62_006495 [Candidatus Aquirickettsiella gammari]|jgi:hypothetical protein|uniref:Uncharacterized protein n=1 Tax=Candidatus Aquirickettsiella gammari TaxID=2016198 RepID=A0A370CFJ8_9COXI|nr:MAG: hypothetical protein CFE62_006495 [Candidatus Aquirickettsiella gammari]
MSSGGNNEANRLLEEQIRQQKQELEQKRQAIEQQRMAIIQGQGAQRFDNPNNPNPPAQIIQ